MISRRPETWMTGEETDNERAEQPMASPQQHQHQPGKAESQRPGSNGWGTCAELLLVSAVKKHGSLNWNLIALELKARAILLNISPSCFSEEACRFRYNVLKGKFASSSNTGVSMGDDVNSDGGVLFEELRKLRMSHLKQELQQFDSSIGQLQSRIRKMKEERAQLKSNANTKQGGENNSADLYTKAPKGSDSKTSIARKIDEPSDKAPGITGKSHVEPDFHLENISSPPFDIANRRRPPSMAQDRVFLGKEAQLASTSKSVVKHLSDDLQLAGECSSGKRSLPVQNDQQALVLENEEPVRIDESACNEGAFRVPPSRDQEQGSVELDRKNRPPANPRPQLLYRSASEKGEKDREKARSMATVVEKLEHAEVAQNSGGLSLHVEFPGGEATGASPRGPEPLGRNQVTDDGRESQKSSSAKTTVEDRPKNDLPKVSGVSGESECILRHGTAGRVLDGEAKEGRGSNVDSCVRKDPDSQRTPTISYGRSVGKNRSRLRDGVRSMEQESRLVPASGSKPHRIEDGGRVQADESKAKSKHHISSEQRVEKGKAIGSELVPSGNLDRGSSKGGSESALATNCQEAGDKVVELRDLSDVRKAPSNNKNVEFKDGRDGKKVSSLMKVVGSKESSEERRPVTNNIVSGTMEGTEEKKPTNISTRVVGSKEAVDEKSTSINKVTGSREGSGERSIIVGKVESRETADGKKTMSIRKFVARRQSDEKKQASSAKALEARERIKDLKKLGSNSKRLECTEPSEEKKPSSSKVVEARDVKDVKKPLNSSVVADVDAEVLGSSGPVDRAADRNPLSCISQPMETSPAPLTSSDLPPKIVPSPGRPDVIPTRRRSESPQVFQEGISVKGSRSPHLLHGGSVEQKVATHTDISHKLKRLDSMKAVSSAEGERKRKAVPKSSPDVVREGWPGKRQLEQKPKRNDMDADVVKERKLDPKLKRSRSITNDVSDTLCRKESGDAQEESRDCVESGDRQQGLVDYDTNQFEKSEVGSSMDSIEDMSPSSRKNRREPKVAGKLLPLLECLRVICAHKSAPFFKQRQEYQEKRHYNSVVRRHVDLVMVRSRLEEGAYSGSVEFFRDLLLVFTNALVYNSKDSQEYAGAKALRSCALVEMEKILQTEALLKQHGPATRKREVSKSMEVHRNRPSSGSGVEARKKGTGKNTCEEGADVQGDQQRTGPVEDSPKVCGSPDGNVDEHAVDGRSEAVKKPTPNRVTREESQRKEAPKTKLNPEGNRSSLPVTSKKPKAESAGLLSSKSLEAEEGRPSKAGHLDNSENVSTKFPPKLKDVMCLDTDSKGGGNPPTGAHPRPPQPTKHGAASRPGQTTSRGSRNSKRAGDSSGSNPKKRCRK